MHKLSTVRLFWCINGQLLIRGTINSSCLRAASSPLPPRSDSSRKLFPDGGAGRGRRPSGCVWVSWRKDRGGAGCPGTHHYLTAESKRQEGPSVGTGKEMRPSTASDRWASPTAANCFPQNIQHNSWLEPRSLSTTVLSSICRLPGLLHEQMFTPSSTT